MLKSIKTFFLWQKLMYTKIILIRSIKINERYRNKREYTISDRHVLAAHSLGIGSCWLNQLPGLTNMPLIRELLSDLDVPVNHIVYGSVVMGYAAEEPKQAALRKNVVNIIR